MYELRKIQDQSINGIKKYDTRLIIIIKIKCCTNYLLPNSSMSQNYVEF